MVHTVTLGIYHAFENQLYQWGADKLFQNSDEVIIIELKIYIEDWEN